jgi:hypothetical protein
MHFNNLYNFNISYNRRYIKYNYSIFLNNFNILEIGSLELLKLIS